VEQHHEARIVHEKKIAKLKADLEVLEQRKSSEARLAAEAAEKAAALAFDASSGNEKALSQQVKLAKEKAEHLQQADNLELLAAPLRQQLAAAESELPRFLLSEQIEAVRERFPKLNELSAEITDTIRKLSLPLAEYKRETLALVASSRPLLGNPADGQRHGIAIQRALNEGLRAQLHKNFSTAGFTLFGSLEGADFDSVMRPKLDNLLHALESKLAMQSGLASEGRAFFLAKTNVGGLLGMNVKAGETLSLPANDPDVLRMVASGALEQIVDEKKRGAA
jgi:hypothetical protein